jgi:hypothetical protein
MSDVKTIYRVYRRNDGTLDVASAEAKFTPKRVTLVGDNPAWSYRRHLAPLGHCLTRRAAIEHYLTHLLQENRRLANRMKENQRLLKEARTL